MYLDSESPKTYTRLNYIETTGGQISTFATNLGQLRKNRTTHNVYFVLLCGRQNGLSQSSLTTAAAKFEKKMSTEFWMLVNCVQTQYKILNVMIFIGSWVLRTLFNCFKVIMDFFYTFKESTIELSTSCWFSNVCMLETHLQCALFLKYSIKTLFVNCVPIPRCLPTRYSLFATLEFAF